MSAIRTLLLWCPDWPVIAAGLLDGVPVHEPVAVLHANRVFACSAAARREGVRRGLRRREAQGRCPQLTIVAHDNSRDAKAFERVVLAVEALAPGVEILRPGECAVVARGPVAYYGGEERAAERLVEQVALTTSVEAQVGIADGVFAASLAARTGQIVPPNKSAEFLSDMDIAKLGRPVLADLLLRLGVRTLGEFAALPQSDVLARFGFDAAYGHRLAIGADDRALVVRTPPADLTVVGEYDPPLSRVDMAAFAARSLAERLHERLTGHGLAATRLGIEARTAAGEELCRTWRHDGLLDSAAIADRLRWQLDGWLTGTGRVGALTGRPPAPTAGIEQLRLIPDGVVRHAGMQAGLWGELGEADARAHRALIRVQGLLGPESVFTAVLGGGRGYAERARLVPWGDERPATSAVPRGVRSAGLAQAKRSGSPAAPWPGRLPAPAPATVLTESAPIVVHTADGALLGIDARLNMTGTPMSVSSPKGRPIQITGWAGPWPVDERWWDSGEGNRLVRLQLTLADGRALLVVLRDGKWSLEASYD